MRHLLRRHRTVVFTAFRPVSAYFDSYEDEWFGDDLDIGEWTRQGPDPQPRDIRMRQSNNPATLIRLILLWHVCIIRI
jgi:hypothetical protein